MRCDQFMTILKNLHFADNAKVDKKDTKANLSPLFDCPLKKFHAHPSVPEYSSDDESMVPYYGWHHMKQFIRGKPIHFGFKMWEHYSKQGYLSSFEFYTGKHDNTNPPVYNLGIGNNVVIKLVKAKALAKDCGYKVFFDNYFTSIPLLKEMSKHGVCGMRTCRDNRNAKWPLISQNEMKNKPRGTTDYAICDGILIQKWKDNRDVILVSNFKTIVMSGKKRYQHTAKKYIDVLQPVNFQTYNKHMGYVDAMDQRISTYRV